ncbi:anaphase-promoting complex subunit 5-like [Diadema setosum]|uniref:anaphase-promoting complex subunit 5-like n=1 Tax=Diadema setosum TaxID=31175 RepID=UPI003B3BE180
MDPVNKIRRPREMVTPHKISLLILVFEYSNYGKQAQISGKRKWDPRVSRNFARSVLGWIQGSDIEHDEFITKVKGIHLDLATSLSACLSEIVGGSLASLSDFFCSLNKLLDSSNGEAPVHRHSIIGMFLRRMMLTYDKLSFSQTMRLYSALKTYVGQKPQPVADKSITAIERCVGGVADQSDIAVTMSEVEMDVSMETEGTQMTRGELEGTGCENPDDLYGNLPSQKTYTRRQAEHFIAQQANFLQNDEARALPPDILQKQINELSHKNPDLAETYYLSYLNCLRISEFCGAVHNLHQYFDHMMPQMKGDAGNNNDQEEVRQNFRYAALNLAGLHCRLNHKEEALLVLKEAIRVAHKANDNICLQHALGWLYRLEQKQGVDISDILDHSITKSAELHLPYLTCLDMQNHTKNQALNGVPPSNVFDFLARTDAVNCQHNQPQLVSTSLAQQSALWFMYGYRSMSSLCDQLLLNMFSSKSASASSVVIDSESLCIAVCNQARQQADKGELGIAAEILQFAKSRFPPQTRHAKIWQRYEQEIAFQRALFQVDWVRAQEAINSLAAIDQVTTELRKSLLYACQAERSKALNILQNIVAKCKDKKDGFTTELHVRCLLILSQIHILSDEHTKSITHLQEAWTLCHHHHLTYLGAMATAHLAQTQMLLSMPEHALVLVNAVLPTILTSGSLYDCCCVQFLLAKCQCHIACDNTQLEPEKRKTLLLSAVQLLNNVADGFRMLGSEFKVKDVAYLQAHIYNELGYTSERNKSALLFCSLDEQYSIFQTSALQILWPVV